MHTTSSVENVQMYILLGKFDGIPFSCMFRIKHYLVKLKIRWKEHIFMVVDSGGDEMGHPYPTPAIFHLSLCKPLI